MIFIKTLTVSALACTCVLATAQAGKPTASLEGHVIGNAQDVRISPDLKRAVAQDGMLVWNNTVLLPAATFIKLHFKDVNLRAGDTLTISNSKGRVIETITGRGPKDMGSFWALSVPGDLAAISFSFAKPYKAAPFEIERAIAGNSDLFGSAPEEGQRSICSPAEFEDAVCSEPDAGRWANVQASVGVMFVGDNANSGLFCSGSNVSPNNYVLTNYHCIENQSDCDGAEYVFRYYNQTCGGADPTVDWVSFRCGDVAAFEPVGDCDAGPGDLDFMLTSVIGDPAATFGHVSPDPTPLASGEDIYIVQHPAGRPHEITAGGGADVEVDGSVLRYYGSLDTEGGSSGSPIFRESDHKLIGLHHCAGCDTPGTGNRGMLMTDIVPLIQPFLCTEAVTLSAGPGAGFAEVNGNGNSVVEPGETWQFTPTMRNTSCGAPATAVSATLDLNPGSDSAVTIIDPVASFGDIPAGASVAASNPVQFVIGPDALCGNNVIIDLASIASDQGGFAGSGAVLSAQLGDEPLTLQYSEDFVTNGVDWTVVNGGTGLDPTQTWTTANPGGRVLGLTEPYMIVDSDAAGTVPSFDDELISPVVDLTGFGSVTLQFAHDFRWFSGGPTEQADVDVRSSVTGGAWVNLSNYSGGDTSGTVMLDVTPYIAADLQVRFHYYDSQYDWWWAIDDVVFLGSNGFVCDVFGLVDADGDGVLDEVDNCTDASNPAQTDFDGDGHGNVCDADFDNDCGTNFADLLIMQAGFFTTDPSLDLDNSGMVNFSDLSIMQRLFFLPPGPSAPGALCDESR